MKYFSVPADFSDETITKYSKLNDAYSDSKIIETYGNITVGNSFESGRSADSLPKVDLYDLERYIRYSKKNNIGFNYTINTTHMSNREFTDEYIHSIKKFLHEIYEVGVKSITVALPPLIEIIKSTGLDIEIKASTLCQITNANKAVSFKNAGVDRIVLEESINRDFHTLKRIKEAFGDRVEVIANVVCFKDCIYRAFHYNQMSSDSVKVINDVSRTYYSHRCIMKRYENIANLLKLSWIRPEDIHFYTEIGINYFKLQGRQAVLKGDPVKAVEAYFKGDYQGNLMELLDMFSPTNTFSVYLNNKKLDGFIDMFVKKENFCRHSCEKCRYCDGFATQSINCEETEKTMKLAKNFYEEYDLFKQKVKEISYKSNSVLEDDDLIIKYDL